MMGLYKTLGFCLLLLSCGESPQESKVKEIIFNKNVEKTHHFYLYYKNEHIHCEKNLLENDWCKIKIEPTEEGFVLKKFFHTGIEYAFGISYCEGETADSCTPYRTNLSQKEGECGYRQSIFAQGSNFAFVNACKENVLQKEGSLKHQIDIDKDYIIFSVPPLKENEVLCILSGKKPKPFGVELEFGYVSEVSKNSQEERETFKKDLEIEDLNIPPEMEAENHCELFEGHSTQIKCKLPYPSYNKAHFYIGYVQNNSMAHFICSITSALGYLIDVKFEDLFGVNKSYWNNNWDLNTPIKLVKKGS